MADLNLTYTTQSAPAVAGMVADSERNTDVISKFASIPLQAGKFVKYTDAATDDSKVTLVDTATDVALGVTRWSPIIITPEAAQLASYSAGDQVPVFTTGSVYVVCHVAAVAGTQAFAIISGPSQGDVTNTASSATTTAPVGIFRQTTASAGITAVQLIQTL